MEGARCLGPVGSGRALHRRGMRPVERCEAMRPRKSADRPIHDPGLRRPVLEQQFDVAHPPERVFAMFGDIAAVAACLPGASLTAPPKPAAASKVRSASGSARSPRRFQGAARVRRSPGDMSGRIVGIGNDRAQPVRDPGAKSAIGWCRSSRGRASISPSDTRLQECWREVGRPGLVRDLAGAVDREFAGNLDRRLSGVHRPAEAAPAELNGWRLAFSVFCARRLRVGLVVSRPNEDGAA